MTEQSADRAGARTGAIRLPDAPPEPAKGTGHIVHEWFAVSGGSEHVAEVIAEQYPDAGITTLWSDRKDRFAPGRLHETVLARTPLRRSKAAALPFMPTVWRHLGDLDADWVLCSSHLFAHHARFGGAAATAPKLVYAHTPARYIWTPELDARGASAPARLAAAPFKSLDRRRAAEAVSIAANSEFVRQRIRRAWGRDAIVIHPPVETTRYGLDAPIPLTPAEQVVIDRLPDRFLLGASRFVPYKALEHVIAAGEATRMAVVLAGAGPDGERLAAAAAAASVRVDLVDAPSTPLLNALMRRAAAYVFPPVEDFGLMPIEAMALGTPVVANAVGGAAESVVDGVTGALTADWSGPALAAAVERALAASPAACHDRALEFDTSVFARRLRAWVEDAT